MLSMFKPPVKVRSKKQFKESYFRIIDIVGMIISKLTSYISMSYRDYYDNSLPVNGL